MRMIQKAAAVTLKHAAGRPSIGLALFGCKNRPAYRIVVFPDKAYGRHYEGNIVEELGVFDPLPNYRNEKLVACDIARVKYWIGERNAHISPSILEILGLWGVLPIHPKTFIRARHHREELEEAKLKVAQSLSVKSETVTKESKEEIKAEVENQNQTLTSASAAKFSGREKEEDKTANVESNQTTTNIDK